jgi:hypothetical protein
MGRKGRGFKPKRERLSDNERKAVAWCRSAGLFLLVQSVGVSRVWTVFRTTDGVDIGRYTPATGRYERREGAVSWCGVERDWRKALARLRR